MIEYLQTFYLVYAYIYCLVQKIFIDGIQWNLVPRYKNSRDSFNSVSMKSTAAANVDSTMCINILSCTGLYSY